MAKIVPGILTDDEEDYHKRLRVAEHSSDLIQIDVIDGKFASSMTVGTDIIKKYPSSSSLEIQLMVAYPQNYISELAGLDYVTRIIFPFEIDTDINQNIYIIKGYGKQVALSLNPTTPIEAAFHFYDDVDFLLLMTGTPGFSGQKLGDSTYARIKQIKKMVPELPVEIDIGVNFDNAAKLAEAGADFLVATSALFNAADFKVAYEKLAKLAQVRS